jgi:hypothetical protein
VDPWTKTLDGIAGDACVRTALVKQYSCPARQAPPAPLDSGARQRRGEGYSKRLGPEEEQDHSGREPLLDKAYSRRAGAAYSIKRGAQRCLPAGPLGTKSLENGRYYPRAGKRQPDQINQDSRMESLLSPQQPAHYAGLQPRSWAKRQCASH